MDPNIIIGLIICTIILLIAIYFYLKSGFSDENIQSVLEYYDFTAPSDEKGPYLCLIAGTHGNEPAGTIFLRFLAQKLIQNPQILKKGRLRIIPAINQWGLDRNVRYNGDYFGIASKSDINRNYTENGGTEDISQDVINLIQDASLVIDFHEGWGYHLCQPESVGSTLTPTDYYPALNISDLAVFNINSQPSEHGILEGDRSPRCKIFSAIRGQSCKIPSTLACHMQKNKKAYILVETTGQNDIQKLSIRTKQIETIVKTAMQNLGIID
jgi:hypothetical protein